MWTTTIRGMLVHKLRLILTTASIALGVAFLAGTLILGDTTNAAFTRLFTQVNAGTDVVVREHAAFTESSGAGTTRAPIDASILNQVGTAAGVRVAEGTSSGYALLTDNHGRAILASGGAPTMGYSLPADPSLRGDVKLLTGRAPAGLHEVAIDATSANTHHIALGSTINVLLQGPTRRFTVVGTVGYGDQQNLGGSTSAYFDSATAQKLVGTPGAFDQIDVKAAAGVSDSELAHQLGAILPRGTEAVTGQTVADESAAAVNAGLKFLTILLSVFAGVALFVGSFIIWNAFSMIVTQRSRETALLRAIGATRGQVLRSLVGEALLLGLAASSIGIALGIAVSKGLTALMDALGFSLPGTSTQILSRTVVVSLIVGTVVTVAAAMVPALRATRVLPVEALREAVPGSDHPTWRRATAATILGVLGLTGLLMALYSGGGMGLFGIGALALLLSAIVVAPLTARPLAALIGRPLKWRGLPGELAQQNAMRNPRRTASTATALMIGLTLVVGMGVFASSLKASFGGILDSTNADLFVTPSSTQAPGFSPSVIGVVSKVPGVRTVSPLGFGPARFDGQSSAYASVDPATVGELLNLHLSAGSSLDLTTGEVLVSHTTAESHHWHLGDVIPSQFAATGKHPLNITGIFNQTGGFLNQNYIISIAAQNQYAGRDQLIANGLVQVSPSADATRVRNGIAAALADHPDAQVQDQQQFAAKVGGTVDNLLALVTVMLLLAVVIALLGIVNTLTLSIFERTRELGLLRAVGMTRSQVRSTVRWESVIISLMGALVGAVLGIGLGVALSQALRDQGIKTISVPVLQVGLYIFVAALAGTLAAVAPARRAAKVDMLKAVVSE